MRVRTALLVLAVVAAGGRAAPALADADGYFTAGTQWWDQTFAEAKFQEFREVPQGAFLEGFLYRERWGDKNAFALFGGNALRRDAIYGLSLAKGIRWRLDGSYQQIPHVFSQAARTGYAEIAPGVFILPDSLQSRIQTTPASFNAVMGDFLNAAQHTDLSFRTDITKARLRARPTTGWLVDVRTTRRERAGYKAYGAGFGFATAIEMPEPIQQRTLDADATANYRGRGYKVQAGFGLSSFENKVDALVWDNPKRLTDATGNPGRGRLDLYPDNFVVRGKLALEWELARRTRVAASASASHGSQNDPWLPMSINSAIPQATLDSLPDRSTHAKAWRLAEDLRLTTRPFDRVDATLRAHQHYYQNDTPTHDFIGWVVADQSFTRGALENHPFGNKQTTVGLDVGWSPLRRLKLTGTYEFRKREHTLREIEDDEENVVELRARATPLGDLETSVHYRHGVRVNDRFLLEDYEDESGVLVELPGLRRFDVANRRQDELSADVTWPATEAIDLSAQYGYQQRRYPDSRYGLQLRMQHSGQIQADVHPSSRVGLTAGFGSAWPRSRQASNETGTAPPPTEDAATDWTANIRDRAQWAFGSWNWWLRAKKLRFDASYTFSRDQTAYVFRNGTNTAQNLPDTFYRRHLVESALTWRVRFDTDLALRYGYDQFDFSDFATQDVPLLGVSSIYLGDAVHGYHANLVSVAATRRF